MLTLLAFLTSLQSAQPTDSAVLSGLPLLISTVGESEWCPSGSVSIDLRSGAYVLTPRLPRNRCQVPSAKKPVRSGALSPSDLRRVRSASLRVAVQGARSADCHASETPPGYGLVVISNGGPEKVVLKTEQAFL